MLSKHVGKSIHQASESWAEAKAAYRLFNHPQVNPAAIFEKHATQSLKRMADHQRVFILQDTTCINFGNRPEVSELGSVVGRYGNKKYGFYLHVGLAVSEAGEALGLVHSKLWCRRRMNDPDRRLKRQLPEQEKESAKWKDTSEGIEMGWSDLPAEKGSTLPEIIHVCDREADDLGFLAHLRAKKHGYCVRGKLDRRVRLTDPIQPGEEQKFEEAILSLPVQGEIEIEILGTKENKLMKKPARTARKARLSVRFATVWIRAKKSSYGRHEYFQTEVVSLIEQNPPSRKERVEWLLHTHRPVREMKEALEVVRWYQMRWKVEMYFKTLKSACEVEEALLESADRLERWLAVLSVVAWWVFQLTHQARAMPDAPATVSLKSKEWQVLFLYKHRSKPKPIPETPPSLRQCVHWIASLGGFMGRKSDGEPGALAVYRGWKRFEEIYEAWNVFESSSPRQTCG